MDLTIGKEKMKRAGSVQGFVVLSLLWMASVASATQFPTPKGFKVVNNDSLNNRVKDGTIIRYVWIEENFEFALVFVNTGPPSSYVPSNSTFYLNLITKPGGQFTLWNTVWSANREAPVKENATLALDPSGNLVLSDADGEPVWSTNLKFPTPAIVAAQLDLTGNLQLLNSANKTVWQSFDHPTDSLLPGQYLKSGLKLTGAKSLLSSQGIDYGSGHYSLQALPGGSALFSTRNRTVYYIQSAETKEHTVDYVLKTCLHPNDEYFDSTLGLVIKTDFSQISPKADPKICGHGEKNVSVVIPAPNPPAASFASRFVRMDPDGVLRSYQEKQLRVLRAQTLSELAVAPLSTCFVTFYVTLLK